MNRRWVTRIAEFFRRFTCHDRAWLTFFVIAVLGLPVLLSHTSLQVPEFDDTTLRRLTKERPEIVFIGDSMLESRLDASLLSQLSGRRVSIIEDDGSASGKWFLFVKNYVAALPEKPQRVILFFRDRYLTEPGFRLGGRYLSRLYLAMRTDEPVVDYFLDRPDPGIRGWFDRAIISAYPVTRLHDPAADNLRDRAAGITLRLTGSDVDFDDQLDRTFDRRNLRPDVPSDLGSEDLEADAFDPDPKASFLPHIVESAATAGVDLYFFRVQRRPNAATIANANEPTLLQYVANLRDWLTAQGVGFIDETGDPRITLDLYGDGDHIALEDRKRYTRLFYETHRELFE